MCSYDLREKGGVGFSVYWKFITMAYGGTLVPIILLAQVLFQTLQIGSNYWMAWATPVSEDVKPSVGSSTLMIVYVALAIGSSFCVLVRSTLLKQLCTVLPLNSSTSCPPALFGEKSKIKLFQSTETHSSLSVAEPETFVWRADLCC